MSATAVAVIAATLLIACALTAGVRRLAPRLGFIDRPDGDRKRHAQPTPLMGGLAIGVSFFLSATVLAAVLPRMFDGAKNGTLGLAPLLTSAGLFCLLGLYDDRRGLSPRAKLLGQIAACLPFVVWGEAIGMVGVLGVRCTLGIWSVPFTVFWLVACSNVINLIDGMDGLAGTISCIALMTLAAMATLMGRYDVTAVALLAAASVTGFLVYNWPPAKIFMGDSGSLMLGFLIGALAIQAALKQAACFMLIVPLVLISVPVFDTAMAILRRKLAGRKIGEADRGHIHHRLQAHGLSRVQSLLLIAGLCIAMAGFCVLSVLVNSEFLALLLCCSLLAVLVIARVFGHDEIDMALQHVRAIATLLVDIIQVVPSRLLAVRLTNMAPGQSEDYWQIVCQRLAQCGGKDLEIRFTDLDSRNVVHRLCWRADAPASPATDTWQVRHTVPRDGGILATLTATGTVDDPQWAAKVNEASQLFHTLCRIWPLAPLPRGSRDEGQGFEADVIRFDDSRPQQPHSIASPGEDADPLQQPRAA
ncbi:MAG: MraY family glycosyltransferase [Thermoguttaceae bacterium]|jgi:UDP-GlcNAc:undecaprenyl-phosphate GlcNAc-1-phosphate transferase|nr:MraY family glycosyltransferase [Thermoguttaceae bacterium]